MGRRRKQSEAGLSECECLVALICVLVCMQFLFWPLFFQRHSDDEMGYREPHSAYMSDPSSSGTEWVPISDREVLRCINLNLLTEWKGEKLQLHRSEKLLWRSLSCEERLFNFSRDVKEGRRMRLEYGRKNANGLPDASSRSTWEAFNCDCYFTWDCLRSVGTKQTPDVDRSGSAEGVAEAVAQRSAHEILVPADNNLEIVAIVLGATSVKVRFRGVSDTPLVQYLLPSLLRTATAGFEYWVVVGYDVGDIFFDDNSTIAELRRWFTQHVAIPGKERGINLQLAVVRFLNVLRKPGPVFNFVSACAVVDGADYVYRVNDDTELETVDWAQRMTGQLKAFQPANLGVVGPRGSSDASSKRRMITHDMVHRTHAAIFGLHYPQTLSDWWMDDWISHVYPPENSGKLDDVRIVHHTELVADVHETNPGDPVRYDVDFRHKDFLSDELYKGYSTIRKFLKERCRAGVCDVAVPPSRAPDASHAKLAFKSQRG